MDNFKLGIRFVGINDIGVYELLRQKYPDAHKKLLTYQTYKWLKKPPQQIAEDSTSYFTVAGAKRYIKNTYKLHHKLLGKINMKKIKIRIKDIVYEDEYQFLTGNRLSIDFPIKELTDLKSRLNKNKPIFTTRISNEIDKYDKGMILGSPLGLLKVEKVSQVFDNIKKHPFYSELSTENIKELSGNQMKIIKLVNFLSS